MRTRRISRSILASAIVALVAAGCDDPAKVVQTPACSDCYADQNALIQGLASSYRSLDYDKFAGLFPAAADSAPFYFYLNEPVNGVTRWDLTEELRIHRRMFKCFDGILPGESPIDDHLCLSSITITLAREANGWAERSELYQSPTNPDGLNETRWKVTEAVYYYDGLFDTLSDVDFRADGRANFIVIEDLRKALGASRKFLIYRCEDLGSYAPKPSIQQARTWSTMKTLYR